MSRDSSFSGPVDRLDFAPTANELRHIGHPARALRWAIAYTERVVAGNTIDPTAAHRDHSGSVWRKAPRCRTISARGKASSTIRPVGVPVTYPLSKALGSFPQFHEVARGLRRIERRDCHRPERRLPQPDLAMGQGSHGGASLVEQDRQRRRFMGGVTADFTAYLDGFSPNVQAALRVPQPAAAGPMPELIAPATTIPYELARPPTSCAKLVFQPIGHRPPLRRRSHPPVRQSCPRRY